MLKRKNYQYNVIYEVDVEEGGYVASVPSLPGCHTQGETLEEAEKNIKEATESYLLALKKSRNLFREKKKCTIVR